MFAIFGSLLYIVRGGGFGGPTQPGLLDISAWLKSKNLPSTRNLYIVSLVFLPLVSITFLSTNGFHGFMLLWLTIAISVGYVVTFLFGWGEYFDIGTYPEYFKNHRERPEVDWILFKIFGPLWIPSNSVTHPSYDLIPSPTGDINPYEWRRKRDFVGMILRMCYSVVLFGLIATVKYIFLHTLMSALVAVSLFLPFAIVTGIIYRHNVTLSAQSNIWRYKSPIGKSELMTGFVLHLLIAIAILI